MKIIVVDQHENRRLKIEAALLRNGIVLGAQITHNNMNTLALLATVDVVIVMDDDYITESNMMKLHDIGSHVVLITPHVSLKNAPCKEVILVLSDSQNDEDQLVAQIVKQVNCCRYQKFFPLTSDSSMQAMLNIAKKAASSSASILIQGDTGTGKEVLAKFIHYNSVYANGPFVAINCAAIPETMIEAILFGYEKGAFTSAITSYVGKFEQANHGTILLDEIGEMSLPLQAKLLRVLQEKQVERIGGKETHHIDLKVIAATNKNLKDEISKGKFRQDLYYRLNVITLHCLPLKNRCGDILPLVDYFISYYCQSMHLPLAKISSEAKRQLLDYSWPGNIRELDNAIHRAIILDDDGMIGVDDLQFEYEDDKHASDDIANTDMGLRGREAEVIVSMLKETNGSRTITARRLKISPRTLRHKILKLKQIGMDVP